MIKPSHSSIELAYSPSIKLPCSSTERMRSPSIEPSRSSYTSTTDLSCVDGQQTPRISTRNECWSQHEQKDHRDKDEIFHRKLSPQQKHKEDWQKENRL